jgi:hypothetical protein
MPVRVTGYSMMRGGRIGGILAVMEFYIYAVLLVKGRQQFARISQQNCIREKEHV